VSSARRIVHPAHLAARHRVRFAASIAQAQSADQNLRGRLEEIEGRQWLIVASSLYQSLLLPYPDWCQMDVQALALRKHQERDWEHRDLVRGVQEVVTTALALVVKPECPQATGMTIRLGSGNSISDQVAEAPGFIVRLREPVPVVPKGGFRCGKVTVDLSGEPTPRLAARVPAGDLAAARDSIQCAVRLAADYVSKVSGEGRVPARLELDVTVDGKVVQTNTLELSESGIYRLSVEAIAGKVADFELRIVRIR
jgi:hypothetical protein